MTIYNFSVKDSKGNEKKLSDYKGKVLLVVNTASKCGFTPQYGELETLYKQYQEKGLMILGFPCDQFAHQEPGTNEEIQQFCEINYGVTFPVFAKIEVNGKNADPLFQYLRKQKPDRFLGDSIKWNFTKFLIDKNGGVIARYSPKTKPEEIAPEIEKYLNGNA